MDHNAATGSLDLARESLTPGLDPYRTALDVLGRLHRIVDPERLPAEAADAIRQVFGGVAGVVIARQNAREVRHQVGDRALDAFASAHGHAIVAKAMESGHAVVDGQGSSKTLVVPMSCDGQAVGAYVIEVADLERRYGNTYVDVARLLGRHFAIAFSNAFQARSLAERGAQESEDLFHPELSLRDAKRRYERRLVRQRLKDNSGNIAAAARSLEMDRGQLSRLLKRHGVDKVDYKAGTKALVGPPKVEMIRPVPTGVLGRSAEA